jgi:ornithine decarboxylase
LGINVVGVSFHVGSGATNPDAFSEAIAVARAAFNQGIALGLEMSILDIGGGFSGGTFDTQGNVDLGGVPEAVNAALDLHFPEACGVHILAEPGRYFAEASAHLACLVFGVRPGVGPDGSPTCDYWYANYHQFPTFGPQPLL